MKDARGRLRALVVVVLMLRMPVTVVEIVHMITVLHGLVPTILTVGMLRLGVLGLLVMTSHDDPPWSNEPRTGPLFQWSTGISLWQCFYGTTKAKIDPPQMHGSVQASHTFSWAINRTSSTDLATVDGPVDTDCISARRALYVWPVLGHLQERRCGRGPSNSPVFSLLRPIRSVHPATQQLVTSVYDECMLDDVVFRELTAAESALLTTATLENLNWCGERFSAIDVNTRSEFVHYTILDPCRGDFGWVAEARNEAIGVVWAQHLPPGDPGYGFLDEDTPEVGLWVREDWRGRGLGRALLRCAQGDARTQQVPRISLSVEADNHAKKLYLAEGFVDVPGREADGVMAWSP